MTEGLERSARLRTLDNTEGSGRTLQTLRRRRGGVLPSQGENVHVPAARTRASFSLRPHTPDTPGQHAGAPPPHLPWLQELTRYSTVSRENWQPPVAMCTLGVGEKVPPTPYPQPSPFSGSPESFPLKAGSLLHPSAGPPSLTLMPRRGAISAGQRWEKSETKASILEVSNLFHRPSHAASCLRSLAQTKACTFFQSVLSLNETRSPLCLVTESEF